MDVEVIQVLNMLPGMVFTALPDGRIEFMNESLLQRLGLNAAPVEWPTNHSHPHSAWQSKTAGQQRFSLVMTVRCALGDRALTLECNPSSNGGRVVRWYGSVTEAVEDSSILAEKRNPDDNALRILDSIPVGIGVLEIDGRISAINDHLSQYYGLNLHEVLDWREHEVVHPEDVPVLLKALEGVVGGYPYDIELRLKRADGQYRWFQVIGHPMKSATGEVLRWYALHIDIDDRRRAEDALRKSENELRNIVAALPATVWSTRPDGYCDFINDRWLEYAGISSDEAEGWGWTSVLHPDDVARLSESWASCLVSGIPVDNEARMRGRDGEYRWFLFRAAPFRDERGEIVKWYGTNIDIEDWKRTERALADRERETRLIVDGIAGLIAIFSPDAELIGGNQQILDYFNLPLSALNNWATNGITHPDDLQVCIDSFMGSIKTGEPYDYETRFLRHDGTWRWFQLRGLPLRNPEGEIIRWYGLLTDIDDRKRTEEKLRRNEAFLADAQRLSKTGSFVFNLTSGELTWSAETYRIFDVDLDETVTLDTVLSRLHPDSVPTVEEVVERARSGAADFDYEVTLVAPDQSLKHLRVLAHSETAVNGEQELTGAVQDITESRTAEEALNEARSELSYVTRVTSLGVLTASIAHEVNQPLAGMVVNSSTCLRVLSMDPPDIDVAKDAARRMIRDANRAADVIVRLRELFSRKPPLIEAVDINEIASEVLALLHTDLQRSRLTILTDFGADLPRLEAARVQLQQVIMNLLRNAIEALSSVDDRPRRILLKTEASGGNVQLLVQDNGVGFGQHGTNRIFDTFYTTKLPDGMGIGLSVSRSIIENHNGRMWAETNPGSGATVGFSVPIHHSRVLTDNGMKADLKLTTEIEGGAE